MSAYVYIGIGSNLGDSSRHIRDACSEMCSLAINSEVSCSPVYVTEPVGPQDQPDFYNAVAGFETQLEPDELLAGLQLVEAQHQRERSGQRWGARTLDLDLLLYADQVIQTDVLSVPHPRIRERAFVLQPLFDLAPQLDIPGQGNVHELLEKCDRSGIKHQVNNGS